MKWYVIVTVDEEKTQLVLHGDSNKAALTGLIGLWPARTPPQGSVTIEMVPEEKK